MTKIEVREATKTYGETGPTGDTTRDEVGYELGAEIDGVWVPFASVDQGKLDHAKQRQDAAEKASGKTGAAKPPNGKTEPAS